MIKKSPLQAFMVFIMCLSMISIISPTYLSAQNYSSETNDWWRNSSTYNTKINNLGQNKVLNVPVPILFGITPDNLTRNFGDPRSNGRIHEGLDIMAPMNAPVVTPTDAVVTRIGTGESAGKYVYTANPGGETFAYLHLNEIANIKEGDEIKKGTLIGYVGNTGNAIGGSPHLHFEIKDETGFLDPFDRLKSIFPLADKIEYLRVILNNSGDQKETIQNNIISLYRKELLQAQSLNITLPFSLNATTTNTPTPTINPTANPITIIVANPINTITRTLKLGSIGADVKILQTMLGITSDGSFGPKTKAGVIAFQISQNLTPDGIFGPKSYSILFANNNSSLPLGCTSLTLFSPTTGAKCIPVL